MGFFLNLLSLLWLAFGLSVSYNAVSCETVPATEDDWELERQLKLLKKPSIKTIKTEMGDIYDCINIREQPSLDHPLLRNHKIQMRSSSSLKQRIAKPTSINRNVSQNGYLVTVDCPQGTVPIRRVEREDLRRTKQFTESYARNMHQLIQDSPDAHLAIMRLKSGVQNTFFGISGIPSLHNVTNVGPKQSSSANLWIEKGSNSLQTGWMVSPDLNGDTLTRLFTYWKTNDDGCFNLLCSGFIHVNPNIPVDVVFRYTTEYGSLKQYEIPLKIEKDPKTGSWWLRLDRSEIEIGYWASGLLPEFDAGASFVAWGGLTIVPPHEANPPMGNGHGGEFDYSTMAYFRKLQFVDSSQTWVNPNEGDIESYHQGDGDCYLIKYFGYQGDNGHTFFYGGRRGNC